MTPRLVSDAEAGICDEGVTRRGEFQPCDKPAVAFRIDPEYRNPYPVCKYHTRGEMLPLSALLSQLHGEER